MTSTIALPPDELRRSSERLDPSRLRPADVVTVATDGLRHRKVRTALSALGITIGIAAMVAVLGLSESSRADLNQQIAALGTNLLTVEPSGGFGGGDGALPAEAVAKIGRIGPVQVVADVVTLDQLPLRNDVMSTNETKGLTAMVADVDSGVDPARIGVGRFVARSNDVLHSERGARLGGRATAGDLDGR